MNKTFSLIILTGVAFSSSGKAQSVLNYDAVFGQPTPLAVGAPAFPVALTLPKFDSTLGVLQSATITLSSTMSGAVDVLNLTDSPQSFSNAFASMMITVDGPDGTTVSATPSVNVVSGVANGPAFTISNFGDLTNSASDSVSALLLGAYEASGGGTLSLNVDSSAFGTYGGTGTPGAVGFSGSAAASGDVKVVYTYAAIPEPSSYALLSSLLVLGSVVAWRKKRAAAFAV